MSPLRSFALLSAALLPASTALAQITKTEAAKDTIVSACVAKLDGYTRIVNKIADCDKKLETPIRWSESGPVGPAGVQGPIGPQGPIGARGSIGSTGPQGATGARGAKGDQGLAGPAGPAGAVGPQGAIGLQGATGPIGPIGPQGSAGAVGPQGTIGLTGPQGAVGPIGPQGIPGLAGPTGPTGATGAVGPAGISLPHIIPIPLNTTDATNAAGLQAAIASITDAAYNNPYILLLDAGTYHFSSLPGSPALDLPPYVSLKGAGSNVTAIEGNVQITANSTLSGLHLSTGTLLAPNLSGTTQLFDVDASTGGVQIQLAGPAQLIVNQSVLAYFTVQYNSPTYLQLTMTSDRIQNFWPIPSSASVGIYYRCNGVLADAYEGHPDPTILSLGCTFPNPPAQ